MRIVGIDPGLTRCGWAVIDAPGPRSVHLRGVGVLTTPTDMPPPARLAQISDAFAALVSEHRPQALALERVFAQHNVRTVMGTAQVSGVIMALAHGAGLDVALYTPSEVKAAVTGQGRANKEQVGAMVARIVGLDKPPTPADAADALAIAITHAWKSATTGRATAAQQQWQRARDSARRHT